MKMVSDGEDIWRLKKEGKWEGDQKEARVE